MIMAIKNIEQIKCLQITAILKSKNKINFN